MADMSGVGVAPAASTDPLPTATAAAHAEITAVLTRGASWLMWIAGLSLINTLLMLFGGGWHFLAGLGISELIAAIARELGTVGKVIALLVNAGATGLFLMFYLFSRRGQKWAFITGITFYALDTALVLLFQDWVMAAFHAYVLFRLWQGFRICSELQAFNQNVLPSSAAVSQSNISS